jgi:hypothetical protein
VVDPPFDQHQALAPLARLPRSATFVFTDNDALAATIGVWGPPALVLVWDCCAANPRVRRRPLRQMKLCLFYGDVSAYDWRGDLWDRRVPRPERRTTCQLGEVFRLPLVALHRQAAPFHWQKPVDWVRRLIGCLSRGDVLDPFLGSGTSLVAAAQLGRGGVGIERDPAVADLALARLESWLGADGVLEERW